MQSIYLKTIDSVKADYQRDLVKEAYKIYLKEAYSVGEGSCGKKMKHLLMSIDFMDNKNCDIIRNLNDNIKGCDIETDNNLCYNLSQLNGYKPVPKQTVSPQQCEDYLVWETKEW